MAVIAFGSVKGLLRIGHGSSQKYILIDPVVTAVNHCGSRHLCRVREVVRSGPVQHVLSAHGAAAEIVKVGAALGDIVEIIIGCKDIVVHQIWAMGYFHHEVTVVGIV